MSSKREKICAGNWKMHKNPEETRQFLVRWSEVAKPLSCRILIFPPAYNLFVMSELAAKNNIGFGPQNIYCENSGAFTGEISAAVVKSMGASHVLIGHSERRSYFHEDDVFIAKKVKLALSEGLVPILCIGETQFERHNGRTSTVLRTQLKNGLAQSPKGSQVVIAYEPVWAIGTGQVATPEIAEESHALIRKTLGELWGEEVAPSTSILYGGSVKPDNASALAAQSNIDGFLVGGASLDVESFYSIAQTIS